MNNPAYTVSNTALTLWMMLLVRIRSRSNPIAIAKATQNDVLVSLVTAFNEARSSGDWQALRLATITPEKRRRTIAHHRTICEMLRKRSADDAHRAMRDHLLSTQRNLFE
jgi:DNA-binding FadR family transcriptional regulator